MSEVGLANRLRDEREARGWTQAELASQIGVSRKTVNMIENRLAVPSALLALKLAKSLNAPVEQLFWIDD